MLHLQLFGGFELSDADGAAIALPVRKDRALLALLALRGAGGCDRAGLAEMLWPDRGEEQARKSLRQSLVTLRKSLNGAGDILPADRRQRLSLDPARVAVDARRFEELAARNTFASLREAAELYNGVFLEDLSIRASAFQDWMAGERTRFEDLACSVFAGLAQGLIERGDWDGAGAAARRVIEIDPLREVGHRLLMAALHGAGRRTEALQQFHRLSGVLRQELDVRPDLDTVALYQGIRQQARGIERGAGSQVAGATRNQQSASALALARPGLIVLPLRFIDADADDEVLADGLTEELIESLAAYRWFFVISALQAKVYKDKPVSPRRLAHDLQVRYVVNGTLRRAGNRLELRLVLSETTSGEHLWSDRIGCFLDEVLDAQDQLARQIARTMEPELVRHEDQLALRTPSKDLEAWSLVIRSRRLADLGREDSLAQACTLARQAIAADPESAFGHAGLAWALWVTYKLGERDRSLLPEALQAASRAIDIDPRYYLGHMAAGGCRLSLHDHDGAIESLRRAIDANPSFPVSYNQLISCLTLAGRPHDALSYVEPLDRISPNDPFLGFYRCVRALTYFFVGDDAAAIENAELSLVHHPGWMPSEVVLIASTQRAGMKAEAAAAVRNFQSNHGALTTAEARRLLNFRYERDFQVFGRQLRAAGVLVS